MGFFMSESEVKKSLFKEIGGDDVALIVGLGLITGGVYMIFGVAVAMIVAGSPIFFAGAYKTLRG
jgi:hypothetical protein